MHCLFLCFLSITVALGSIPELPARSCWEIKASEGEDTISKKYWLDPLGTREYVFEVFCDQKISSGGWTVFQRRVDGSVDFFLDWTDYKHGFGNLSGEFWLGLDKIHRLISDHNNVLRVDLEDFEGNTAYAEYNMFGVMSRENKYKLILGAYSGKKKCSACKESGGGKISKVEGT